MKGRLSIHRVPVFEEVLILHPIEVPFYLFND